jgi:hypothetical protein
VEYFGTTRVRSRNTMGIATGPNVNPFQLVFVE